MKYALMGVSLYAVMPGPIHDAAMARPETLMALFLVLFLWALVKGELSNGLPSAMIAGLSVGALAAVKFNYFLLTPIFLLSNQAGSLTITRVKIFRFAAYCCCLVLMLYGLCPGMLLDTPGYIDGIKALRKQYLGLHPPHSHIHGGNTLLMQLRFYVSVYGLLVFFPIYFVFAKKKLPSAGFYPALVFISFVLIAGSASVFFERNMHPLLPVLPFLFCLWIDKTSSKAWASMLSIFVFSTVMYWSSQIYSVRFSDNGRSRIESDLKDRYRDTNIKDAGFIYSDQDCGLIRLTNYSDEYSREAAIIYGRQGWREVAYTLSPFKSLPVSTLQVYLRPSFLYFHKACAQ